MSRNIWYLITVFWALVFVGSIVYSVPEPSWNQEEVVEDVDQRFMDLEVADSKINLVYRDSINSGVILKTKNAESGLTDSLENFYRESNWSKKEVVDQSQGSGSYLSAAEVDGKLMVAYQDASIGDERVVVASRNRSGWSKNVVDDVRYGGVNVGMYTSLTSYQDKPMALYHSPKQGLKSATQTDKSWKRRVVAEETGWFTDSTSCGEKVFTAYRGRDSSNLTISTFDGSWSTEEVESSVKSSLSIDQENCQPHIVYLNNGEKIIYRSPTGEEDILTDSAYSEVSIDTSQGIKASYYDYGEGMVYAEKNGDNWEKKRLTNSSKTGKYNELAVDKEGNIHLIFAQDSDIIHAEKNLGQIKNLNKILDYIRILLGSVLVILLAKSFREYQKTPKDSGEEDV